MSTVILDRNTPRRKVIHFIISTIIAFTIVSLFFMDDKKYEVRIKQEVAQAIELLGTDWHEINKKIEARYNDMYYNSGMYEQVRYIFLPKGESHFQFLVKNDMSFRAVNNISLFVYQVVYRLTTFEYWLALLGPLLICIVYQGVIKWRINRYRMGGANTSRARIYMKLVWLCSLSVAIIFAIPNMFAAFGVYIPALLMLTIAFVTSKFIASYQKDF